MAEFCAPILPIIAGFVLAFLCFWLSESWNEHRFRKEIERWAAEIEADWERSHGADDA